MCAGVSMNEYVYVCGCVCVCACVRVSVCACACACACVSACERASARVGVSFYSIIFGILPGRVYRYSVVSFMH